MSSDDLEPGQDDLVKEDKATRKLVQKARNINLSTVSSDEAMYTDHGAGDPSQLIPQAERDNSVERRVGSPVKGTLRQKMRAGVIRLSDVFGEARQARANRGYRG